LPAGAQLLWLSSSTDRRKVLFAFLLVSKEEPLGLRFARQRAIVLAFRRHRSAKSSFVFLFLQEKEAPDIEPGADHSYLSARYRRIWHLALARRLSGFTGPVPSAALDKQTIQFSGLL